MKTSEVLNLAADLIRERGWHDRGTPGDPWGNHGGALCLEGGITAAIGARYGDGRTTRCPAFHAVQEYLGTHSPWRFNDTLGRTAEEVIEVLRACAVIEEARENAEVLEKVSA